ncbi:MAG: hydrogenase [Deltaproteobacteria bacterium]|nr:hydrogenase [Deltaproteobacteria bacterium]
MTSAAIQALLVAIFFLNLFVLGTSRLRSTITASAAQGIVAGLLAVFIHGNHLGRSFLVAGGTIAIKGVLIPGLLQRALRETKARREVEPYIGFSTSLLLGAAATGAAILFAERLPLADEHQGMLLVPASMATILTGFIVLTTRRKAITQVVGYLVLENGVFLTALLLHDALPSLVEIGVLLDLLVAIFVIAIVINHVQRDFSSEGGDVAEFHRLREE